MWVPSSVVNEDSDLLFAYSLSAEVYLLLALLRSKFIYLGSFWSHARLYLRSSTTSRLLHILAGNKTMS